MKTKIIKFIEERKEAKEHDLPSSEEMRDERERIEQRLRKISDDLLDMFLKFRFEDNVDMNSIMGAIDLIKDNYLTSIISSNKERYKTFDILMRDLKNINSIPLIASFLNELSPDMGKRISSMSPTARKYINSYMIEFMALPADLKKQFTHNKALPKSRSDSDISNAMYSCIMYKAINKTETSVRQVVNSKEKNDLAMSVAYDKGGVLVVRLSSADDVVAISKALDRSGPPMLVDYPDVFMNTKSSTKYALFDFNLPSTSAHSFCLLAVKDDGKCAQHMCARKDGEIIRDIDDVLSFHNIPGGVIVPDDILLRMSEAKEKLQSQKELPSMSKIIRSQNKKLSTRDLIELARYVKDNKIVTAEKIKNTFGEKSLDATKELLDDRVVSALTCASMPRESIVVFLSSFNKNVSHYGVFYIFGVIGRLYGIDAAVDLMQSVAKNFTFILTDIGIPFDAAVLKRNLSIDDKEETNLFYDATKGNMERDSISIVSSMTEDITKSLREGILKGQKFDSFSTYKEMYDAFVLDDDEIPYETLFITDSYESVFLEYEDSEDFINIVVKYVSTLINDKKLEDAASVINDLISLPYTNSEYATPDTENLAQAVIFMLEKLNAISTLGPIIAEKSTLSGMFLYRETRDDSIGDVVKREMDIKTDSNGNDYIVFDGFTDLDFMFDNDYFTILRDNNYFYWYDLDDSILEDNAGDMDGFNTLWVADAVLEACAECDEDIKREIVAKYFNRRRLFLNVYNNDELNELKNKVVYVVFDKEDFENNDIKDILDDEVKREIFYRASMMAEESAMYDSYFSTCMSEIEDFLGGSNVWDHGVWTWISGRLALSVDLHHLLSFDMRFEDIDSYYGDSPSIIDLISYLIDEEGNKIRLESKFEYISVYPDRNDFNEALRNL